MQKFISYSALFGRAIYALFSLALLIVSLAMVSYGLLDIWRAVRVSQDVIGTLLDAIGLIVIAIAVLDVSKYLLEEEVLRPRELRLPGEARKTLTKFLVIIAIAVMLEALVFIFGAGRRDVKTLLYPTLLLIASVVLVVGLGWYQRLSKDIESGGETEGRSGPV